MENFIGIFNRMQLCDNFIPLRSI